MSVASLTIGSMVLTPLVLLVVDLARGDRRQSS